jgi:hypothetical protein
MGVGFIPKGSNNSLATCRAALVSSWVNASDLDASLDSGCGAFFGLLMVVRYLRISTHVK